VEWIDWQHTKRDRKSFIFETPVSWFHVISLCKWVVFLLLLVMVILRNWLIINSRSVLNFYLSCLLSWSFKEFSYLNIEDVSSKFVISFILSEKRIKYYPTGGVIFWNLWCKNLMKSILLKGVNKSHSYCL
jgi:hypothetical protein